MTIKRVGRMASLDDLVQLFGLPPTREPSPDAWVEVEDYVGSSLPGDFKTSSTPMAPV
ncbi:hypothetical protein ABZ891_19815 [Streptomyces sp. NPDC047023]|uniref:hypothetical protein n=1 Tax=Streptomyces sp. NPDC047023 TaxID=3155139 RepID=UPI0033EEDB8F